MCLRRKPAGYWSRQWHQRGFMTCGPWGLGLLRDLAPPSTGDSCGSGSAGRAAPRRGTPVGPVRWPALLVEYPGGWQAQSRTVWFRQAWIPTRVKGAAGRRTRRTGGLWRRPLAPCRVSRGIAPLGLRALWRWQIFLAAFPLSGSGQSPILLLGRPRPRLSQDPSRRYPLCPLLPQRVGPALGETCLSLLVGVI